jgi:hypothetical protein
MAKYFQVDTTGTLTTGLVSYYKAEDATDFYGSNNLTPVGSPTYTAAKVNNGFTLNGSSQYLTTSSQIISGTAFSISFWLKSAGTQGTYANAIGNEINVSSNNYNYDFQYNYPTANVMNFMYGKGNGSWYGLSFGYNPSSDTAWHMLTMTYDGTTIKIYLDGTLVTSVTDTIVLSTQETWIGNQKANSNREWYGQIDEVGFWNKALSTTEISNLYNNGNGQTMVSSTTYTGTASLTMMNAASRLATASYRHLINWVRTASVSMMNGASRYALASWYKVVGFIRTASVSMMNSASRFSTATRSFIIKIGSTIRWNFFDWS